MEKIDMLKSFGKMFIINIYVYYMFLIILGYKKNNLKKKIIVAISSIMISLIYVLFKQQINQIFIVPIIYVNYTIIIKVLLKEKINYSLFITTISFSITYIIYFISILFTGVILGLFYQDISYNSFIVLIIIYFNMFFIYYNISKIKRLKNGINFLKNTQNIGKISRVINIISLIILLIFMSPTNSDNISLYTIMTFIVTILTITITYWTKSQITKYYKKNMRDRTIEVQKTEIDEQKKIIEEVKEENLKLAEVVHKYNNRLSAVEMALEDAINKNMNTEFSNELSIVLNETKEISKNFSKESEVIKTKLSLTNITGIDNMFKYLQNEAIKNNINFDLKLNNSIHDLIENIIPKDKFETLLGDHLRDAIIAIKSSNNTYRSILVTLGIVENYYELSIYDTGIEFEIETLLKLGKERITTHKDTGGSGIGFMTTFETLKETKASLEIEEYNPKDSSYTKSVNIIFDGKCEYRICSYRAEEINKQNKDKKIIVKNI